MAYTPEQLSDMQCIRDAALRYCRGVDRLDVELMKSAYWRAPPMTTACSLATPGNFARCVWRRTCLGAARITAF